MLTRTVRTAAKRKKPPSARKSPSFKQTPNRAPAKTGALPEWDLSDLYPGIDSPQIKDDLARADALCLAFEDQYKGKLAALAAGPDGGKSLAAAVKSLESI